MKSGAMQRRYADNRSSAPRHWKPLSGKPCRKSATSPTPRSTYAMSPNGVSAKRRDAWKLAAFMGRGRRRPHPVTAAVVSVSRNARRFIVGDVGCEYAGDEHDHREYEDGRQHERRQCTTLRAITGVTLRPVLRAISITRAPTMRPTPAFQLYSTAGVKPIASLDPVCRTAAPPTTRVSPFQP